MLMQPMQPYMQASGSTPSNVPGIQQEQIEQQQYLLQQQQLQQQISQLQPFQQQAFPQQPTERRRDDIYEREKANKAQEAEHEDAAEWDRLQLEAHHEKRSSDIAAAKLNGQILHFKYNGTTQEAWTLRT